LALAQGAACKMGHILLSNDLNRTRTQKPISTVHSLLLDSSVGGKIYPKKLHPDQPCAAALTYNGRAHFRQRRRQRSQRQVSVLWCLSYQRRERFRNSPE